jgi:hypothetical protein
VKSLEVRVQPAVHTWNGSASTLWSNAANWTGGSPSGDSQARLVFPAKASHTTNNNDLSGLSIYSISLARAGYKITGNAVQLGAGGISASNTTGTNEIDCAFTLLANSGVTATGAGTTLTLGGAIGGAFQLTVAGGGAVVLAGTAANTYGATAVTSGTLELNKTAAIAIPGALTAGGGSAAAAVQYLADDQVADTAAVTVATNGLLQLNNHSDVVGPLGLAGGTVATGLGTLTLTGDVTVQASATTASISGNLDLGGVARTFNVAAGTANPSLSVAATVSDGQVIKQGGGSLDLPSGATALPYQVSNGAANWGQSGVTMTNVYTFAVDGGVLFAGGRVASASGGSTARLLSSSDGQTWSGVNVPFKSSDKDLRQLFVGPDGALYAVTSGTARIYRSANGLTNWQLVATLNSAVSYGSCFAQLNGYMYVGTATASGTGAYLYRSSDGTHWGVAYQFGSTITQVQSLLASAGQLYASTGSAGPGQAGGVFGSTDGVNWAKLNTAQWQGPAGVFVDALTSWDGHLWVGTRNSTSGAGVFSSADGGATWQQVNANGFGIGAAEQEACSLTVWQGNLVVGTYDTTDGGRLWMTQDGSHWYELGAPGDRLGSQFQGILATAVFNGQLYAAERDPSPTSALASRPLSVALLQTGIVIDAGSVTDEGRVGGAVSQSGGTFGGTGLATAVTVSGQALATVAGRAVTGVQVATFTDADPDGLASLFSATVAWGDGQTSGTAAGTVTIQADPTRPGVFDVLASKPGAYTVSGSDTVTVTVTDAAGASGSGTGTASVAAGSAASVTWGAPAGATAGAAFAVMLTLLDAYGNVATCYTGTVQFSSTDSHALLPGN